MSVRRKTKQKKLSFVTSNCVVPKLTTVDAQAIVLAKNDTVNARTVSKMATAALISIANQKVAGLSAQKTPSAEFNARPVVLQSVIKSDAVDDSAAKHITEMVVELRAGNLSIQSLSPILQKAVARASQLPQVALQIRRHNIGVENVDECDKAMSDALVDAYCYEIWQSAQS